MKKDTLWNDDMKEAGHEKKHDHGKKTYRTLILYNVQRNGMITKKRARKN